MSQARPLSSEDVRGLREELAAGTTPTVWFTDSAVGVEPGRSGKVTALDDSAEGDFVQVRPAGSKDVLSFSAGEVTVVKPPRKRKETRTEPASTGSGSKGGRTSSAASRDGGGSSAAGTAARGTAPEQQRGPAASNGASARRSTGESAGTRGSTKDTKDTKDRKDTKDTGSTKDTGTGGRSARSSGAQRSKQGSPAGATITMTAGPEGRWSVEVNNGKKRVLRSLPVPASAVAHAAKALHEDVAEAVEPLLEAAREQQRARVEQLQRELDEAQQALNNLNG